MILEPVLQDRDFSHRGFYHHEGGSPIRIAQRNKTKLSGRVDDQVFCHPTHMGHRETRPHHELHNKVPITDSIQTVLCYALKSELLGEEITIDDEWVASERS